MDHGRSAEALLEEPVSKTALSSEVPRPGAPQLHVEPRRRYLDVEACRRKSTQAVWNSARWPLYARPGAPERTETA